MSTIKLKLSCIAAVLGIVLPLAGPRSARASTIMYDNFAPGLTFDHNMADAWWIYSTGFGSGNDGGIAKAFTPSFSGKVDYVIAPLDVYNNYSNQADWGIYTDASGVPGTALNQQLTPALTQGGFTSNENPPLIALVPNTPVYVQQGQQYWVVLKLDNTTDTSVRWYAGTADTTSTIAASLDYGTTWFVQSGGRQRAVMQVYGTVPEPASLALLGLGGLVLLRRRRAGMSGT